MYIYIYIYLSYIDNILHISHFEEFKDRGCIGVCEEPQVGDRESVSIFIAVKQMV